LNAISSTSSGTARRVVIRATTPHDLPIVRDLLTERDGRAWDDASTAWFLHGLDPERCLGWLAFAGDRPAGLSTVFRRTLRGPGGTWRAGYWANLFVRPDARDLMLYPRLTTTMLAAAPGLGLDVLYGGTRQKNVAFAHTRMGFTTIGTVPLLVKPLRPARLLAKYRGWPVLGAVAAPIDALWGLSLAASRMGTGGASEVAEGPGAQARAWSERLAAVAERRVVDAWTPESFAYRYERTREGTSYHLLHDEHGSALIWRLAEREPDIRAAVVMDVLPSPDGHRSLGAVLAEFERRSRRSGAEVAMFLSGLGEGVHAAFGRAGYRPAHESYDLQVWPAAALAATPALADPGSWRFTFGDHDAF
jgi:hypothetical protein